MAIKRLTTKTDWPQRMAHVAYISAGISLVLVFTQFFLYSLHYNRIFSSDSITAVTLANGQTYFGVMEKFGPHTVVLFHVYYLQAGDTTGETTDLTDTTDTADTESNLKLIKLADDFHQPNDYLVINRDQVLFWQHLEPSSPILEAMQEYATQ
ncbi:MAG: hypothetical protein HY565_01540 [Candidatus Kerfeldbacteria bacterium]|nr:hypothetical protein [Candidatus Kerfeldbacteria bacterium]